MKTETLALIDWPLSILASPDSARAAQAFLEDLRRLPNSAALTIHFHESWDLRRFSVQREK